MAIWSGSSLDLSPAALSEAEVLAQLPTLQGWAPASEAAAPRSRVAPPAPREALIEAAMRAGFGTLGGIAPEAAARLAVRLFLKPRRHPRPARERALLAEGTPLRLRGEMAATAWGEGPAVLLVHGWEGRGAQLGAFVAPLVAAGRRVVALDGPAHGDSPGDETNLGEFADFLADAGREFGPVDAVIGHSFGASATIFALTRGLKAERVVLIAGPGAVARVFKRFSAYIGLPPKAAVAFKRIVETRVGIPAEEIDVARLAVDLKTRALVIHDPADNDVPYLEAEAIAAAWPGGATLLPAHGLGHRYLLRDPGVVAQVVKFLTD